PTTTTIARVAPLVPKRSAAQIKAQKQRYAHGPSLRDVISPVAARARSSTIASTMRALTASGLGGHQASASGTTTRPPEKSPSHHVRQTVGSESAVSTPPSRSERGPIVALIAAPAA